MYSAQHVIMSYIDAMKRRYLDHVVRGEDNAPSLNDQRISLSQTWNNFISGNYFHSMRSANNQLSVTIVNDEILTTGLLKNSPMKTKDFSYTLREEKSLHELNSLTYSKNYIESMLSVPTLRTPEMDLQDWDIIDHSHSVKMKNDVNLVKNFDNTYKNNSTMESQSTLQINKMEKATDDNIISGPWNVDLRKSEVDIHKDTDVESFFMVSHSDVPAMFVDFVRENPMSRFSNVCLNAWNSLTSRLYCKTESTRMSVKRPLYVIKQHHRRKANIIAMGRGRGRAKCQLRRSGVSQTICRKEYIKYKDNEALQNNCIYGTAPNDYSLDSNFDSLFNIDIPEPGHVTKQINSSSIFNPKATSMKRRSKTRKKKKTKAKCMMRYPAKPLKIDDCDYQGNSSSVMSKVQKDSSQSRTLSEQSTNTEDDWIVFENNDEELPETREKRGATEYPIRARHVPNSLIKENDSSYEEFKSQIRNVTNVLSRVWPLSKNSTDSEDSNYDSTVSDEQEAMGCLRRMRVRLSMSDERCEDFNNQMQKKSLQHRRLLSDSSATSDDSNTSNSSFTTEDDVYDYDDVNYDGDSQDDSIVFADEDNEKLTTQTISKISLTFSNSCFTEESDDKISYDGDSQDDSIVFADEDSEESIEQINTSNSSTYNSSYTEEKDDVDGYDVSFHEGSQDSSIIFADQSNEESTKKVSFDLNPAVHVMVTWNYAYRAARRGPWEEIARDNERFKGRINSIAIVLDPILRSTHRSQVWQERFAFPE